MEFANVISVANDADDWITLIKKIFKSVDSVGTIERRREIAAKNTWEARVDSLLNHIL